MIDNVVIFVKFVRITAFFFGHKTREVWCHNQWSRIFWRGRIGKEKNFHFHCCVSHLGGWTYFKLCY